jgi:putative SOS response-associated peptidase YedK
LLRIVRVHDLSVPGNLSRVSWKLSRTVLRGGTNSNVGPLLGKKSGKEKQPFHFGMKDNSLFAFAGVWDRWKSASGQLLESCSILTTSPNELLDDVHDRMPVILPQRHYQTWLTAPAAETQRLAELLVPFDASFMKRYAVSPLVNNPQNEMPECALEVPNSETQTKLWG